MTVRASSDKHPLADYELRAVVDWVEVRVTLAASSQPQHVRARIKRELPHWGTPPYVQADTDDSSRTAHSFMFRVQDPPGPEKLLTDIQALRPPGTPALTEDDIEVLGLEVSVDAYPRSAQAHADLVGIVLYFFKGHARPPAGTTRVCGPHGGEIAFQPARIGATLAAGNCTINCGDHDAAHRSRYYVKAHDTIDGTAYAPLPIDAHRARMEVTLTGNQVPFATLAGWRSYNFHKLARLLALRQVEIAETNTRPLLALLRDQARHGGQPRNLLHRYERRFKPHTAADAIGNERIRKALQALTRHQRGAAPRRRSAQQ